jgi:hypothetical protein
MPEVVGILSGSEQARGDADSANRWSAPHDLKP